MADSGYKRLRNELPDPAEKIGRDFCQICENKHLRPSAQCETCQKYLCDKCVENHETDLTFANHLITSIGRARGNESVSKRKYYSSFGWINIRAKDDKNTCYAPGIVFLTTDLLAIADKANKCVKFVDVIKNEIVSKIRLTSGPRDLTVVPPDRLAVTLKDEEIIQMISIKPEISKIGQIKTNGKCHGIAYSQDRLIVSFDSLLFSKIQVLNTKGEILNTFDFSEKEDYIVYNPRAVALSPDENHIYVTDLQKSSLFRLSWTGKLTAVYKDLGEVTGLAIAGKEAVYTCSRDRNSVRRFPADLSRSKVVLDVNDGLCGPLALAYCGNMNRLYISYKKGHDEGRNRIHVFSIN